MRASTKQERLALLIATAIAIGSASGAAAQAVTPQQPASRPAAVAGKLADGKVLEVDRKAQRVLVEHGPIQSIGMDAMTMEFLVPDRRVLDALRIGARIRFAADWKDGEYRITRVERVGRPPKGTRVPPAH